MSNDLKKLKVIIEADASRYKKAINDVKKDTKEGVESVQNAMKRNIDPDPFNLHDIKAKLAEVRNQFQSTFASIKAASGLRGLSNPFSGIAEAMKEQSKAKRLESGRLTYTDDYMNATDGIERMTKALDSYHAKERDFAAAGIPYESEEWAKVQGKIYDAENALKSYQTQKKDLEMSGGDVQNNPDFKNGGGSGFFKNIGNSVASGGGKFLTAISKAGGAAAAIMQKMRSGIAAVGNDVSGLASRFGLLRRSGGGALNGLGGGFRKLLAYGFGIRSLFVLFNRLRSAVVTGFQNMAQADPTGQVNRNLSTLMSSLTQLKNAWAAAFAPILNVVTPVLNTLINACTRAATEVGQLFAALTGQKMVVQAKKVNQNYAASLNSTASNAKKAAKELKEYQKTLLGIDEINKMDSQNSNSGNADGSAAAGGINPSDMFETKGIDGKFKNLADEIKKAWQDADFTDIGKIVGEKINSALASIPWAEIQETCNRAAKSLATFTNGIVYGTDWGLVGRTVADGVNTITSTIHTFFTNTDWQALGAGIGTSIQSSFDHIDWDTLGKSLTDGVKAISDTVHGMLPQLNFASIGTDIGTAINSALENIPWEQAINDAVDGVSGVFTALSKAMDAIKWGDISSRISNGIDTADWSGAGQSLSEAISSILTAGIDIVYNFDWSGLGADIVDFITHINWLELIAQLIILLGDIIIKIPFQIVDGIITGTDWPAVGQRILNAFQNFDWKRFLDGIVDIVAAAVKTMMDIGKLIDQLEEAGANLVAGFYKGIFDAIKDVGDWIYNNIFKPFIDGFKSAFGIHSPATTMEEPGKMIIAGLLNGITTGFKNVTAFFASLPDKIRTTIGDAAKWLVGKGSNIIDGLKTGIDNVKDAKLFKFFSGLGDTLKNKIGGIGNSIKSKGSEIVNGLSSGIDISVVTDKIDRVVRGIKNGLSGLWSIGSDAMSSLASGFGSIDIKLPHFRADFDNYEIFGHSVSLPHFSVDWYANGGFPQTGQLFAARESGPELVGQIGNRTAVANNDQIVDAVSEGVFKAVVSAMDGKQQQGNGGDVVLMIDGEKIGRIIGEINAERNKRYNPVVSVY